jgi:hypothetical protein
MAKRSNVPESGRLTVKGLNRVILSTHQAAVNQAKTVRKALEKAGMGGLQVVIPGEKMKMPKGINKRKPTSAIRSPE